MTRLVLKRLLSGIVVLWIISMAVFALFFIAPHNVAQKPSPAVRPRRRPSRRWPGGWASNRPILDQYGSFVWQLLHGNLGYSYYNTEPVISLIGSRIGVTISLVIGGAVLWLLIGIRTGVLAATHPRSFIDKGATFFAVFFYSMPTFLLGLILLYFLFFQLHLAGIPIFPGSGYVSIFDEPGPVGPAPDPAVDRRGPDHRRHLHPADPGRHARGAGRGLHPHRAGQGRRRTAGSPTGTPCAPRSPRW